jgi:hypothetical protein
MRNSGPDYDNFRDFQECRFVPNQFIAKGERHIISAILDGYTVNFRTAVR